jgi:nicotinate-nucleotide adenylyltransferase
LTQPVPRIGMFGGAFDPPHEAHVALVRAALAQLALDVLYVFPTGYAWHKTRTLSPATDRLAMARLAFDEGPAVRVDAREMLRPGPTYTIDTLTELQAEWPGAQLFLILGGDQAAALPSWQRWRDIPQIAIISIAARDGSTLTRADFAAENPVSGLEGERFQALRVPPMSLSATEVRQRVAAGLGIDHLVPASVARYIDQHHLYLAT